MACCICLAVLHACAPREKNSSSIPTDSTSLTDKVATGLKEEPTLGNTPLDTIVVSYPNGKKLHLLVLEYYDSLPDKPIKDFEVIIDKRNDNISLFVYRTAITFVADDSYACFIKTTYCQQLTQVSILFGFLRTKKVVCYGH